MPEGGPVTYPLFGGNGAAEFLAPYTPEDVCVGGAEQQFDELGTPEAQVTQSIPTAHVKAPLKEPVRWVLSKVALVRNGGDCGPDTAAWLLKHYGPPVHREGPYTTREGIRQALQKAWRRVIEDDTSFDESRNFIVQRIEQVPEARGQSCLEAQTETVLNALLRQESHIPAAEDHDQLAAQAPLPYWFIASDWVQLSKFLQVDFVIHGMPGTENRPCHHCRTNGHVHMGARDPGTDIDLHLRWRGTGQGDADGAAWGHWEPLVPDCCFEGAQALSSKPSAQATAIQTDSDAFIAAQLQQEEEDARGRAGTTNPSGQGSLRRSRTDDEMKELLKTLQVPHFVCESRTHGQHNCLMDSILLALQDKQHIKPLEIHERAAICSSIRRHLIEHHGIEPEGPDGSHSYLSHEASFDAICQQLRNEHPEIWFDHIDVTRLSIVAVVFDRFHRQQLYDNSGAWTDEMEELNAPVVSKPMNASGQLDEVWIQLYCNTHDDDYGTPYHYEWISDEADRKEEEGESSVEDDEDDENNNPAPPPILTSDDEDSLLPLLTSGNDDNTAPPLPASGVDQDGDDNQALPVPELPLRTQQSTLSMCALGSFRLILKIKNHSLPLPRLRKCVRVRM